MAAAEQDARAPGRVERRPATEEAVREALKHVVDPELGVNIVDLGLVYGVEISDEGAISIEYTLTTMACPIGPLIEHRDAVLPGERARRHLGARRRWSSARRGRRR